MSRFKKLLAETSAEVKELNVAKMPDNVAPKKENKEMTNALPRTKEVAEVLDMMYILKSAKQSVGEVLSQKDLAMFADELHTKAGTTIADVSAVIPSGFSGRFIQDMYAMTGLEGIIGMESINTFGMTDSVGAFGMEAFVVSEYGTPADTNDSQIDFEYRGGKLMALSKISYEALADATIDMLANKRLGLMRAMATAIESAATSTTGTATATASYLGQSATVTASASSVGTTTVIGSGAASGLSASVGFSDFVSAGWDSIYGSIAGSTMNTISSGLKLIRFFTDMRFQSQAKSLQSEINAKTEQYDKAQLELEEMNDKEVNIAVEDIKWYTDGLKIQSQVYDVDYLYGGTKFNIGRPSFCTGRGSNIISNDVFDVNKI